MGGPIRHLGDPSGDRRGGDRPDARGPESANPELQLAQRAQQRAAASEELLALVEGDAETHGQLAAAIACSAAWLPARERTKTNNIRVINEMRIANREIGRRMVERGVFDEIEDFGFLLKDEYDDLCHGGSTAGVLDTVRERRAEYQSLETKQPPFVFVGSDPGPSTWPIRGETTFDVLTVGNTIQGMPGCPGTAEGIARVILDPSDPSALEPGDVLVAPMTDPAWTPLFVPAAAVVVDVGAALSHAIIVSRELGIPLRGVGHRRHPPHPRGCAGARRRVHRNGRGARRARLSRNRPG